MTDSPAARSVGDRSAERLDAELRARSSGTGKLPAQAGRPHLRPGHDSCGIRNSCYGSYGSCGIGSSCECACSAEGLDGRCTLAAAYAVCDADGDGTIALEEFQTFDTALLRQHLDRYAPFADSQLEGLCSPMRVASTDGARPTCTGQSCGPTGRTGGTAPVTFDEFHARYRTQIKQSRAEAGGSSIWAYGLQPEHRSATTVLQLLPAGLVMLWAILDLALRTPPQSPGREMMEVERDIKVTLPSLIWRVVNWWTCFAWVVVELWGASLDTAGLAAMGSCQSNEEVEAVRRGVRDVAWMASLCLLFNGLLCAWALQFYHGVHRLYHRLGATNADGERRYPIPADAYLAELTGIELILGAADTCMVNLPVGVFCSQLFDLGVGLGMMGHLNLAVSVVTYILNTWLFADKSPTIDSYRMRNGGAPNYCPTSSARLWEFLLYIIAFPVAWLSMGLCALPALSLIFSGFDPGSMRLNWCCVPRFHHHRTEEFASNEMVNALFNLFRFPGLALLGCPRAGDRERPTAENRLPEELVLRE
jgi:hypothetical protein